MDREIESGVRKRRALRRVGAGALALGAVVALLVWLPGMLRPSLRRSEIRSARVERGRLEATLEASGTVIPAFEKVLSSPIEARVERILLRPGAAVRPGDEILRLDTAATQLEIERGAERLARKRNEQEQERLRLQAILAGLRSRIETRKLDLEILQYRAGQRRQLRAAGLISEEAMREAEVEARKAQIELDQTGESVRAEERSTGAALATLDLDLRILTKELDEQRRQLALATSRSDRDGVLTWVVPQEGATVRRGDVLARIADLDRFRVEASLSDVHAAKLAPGLPVRVLLDGAALAGRLTQVYPTIENGAARFAAELDDPSDRRLRNSLRADVLVVTDERTDVLKVKKGPFADGGRTESAFVVRGGVAVRTRVRLGLSGRDEVEILEGLAVGDEVIVSDVQEYLHLERVKIR